MVRGCFPGGCNLFPNCVCWQWKSRSTGPFPFYKNESNKGNRALRQESRQLPNPSSPLATHLVQDRGQTGKTISQQIILHLENIDLKIHMKYLSNFYQFEYQLYLYYLSTHACHLFIYIYICVYNIFMVNSETFFNCALLINQRNYVRVLKCNEVISSAPCAVVQML